MQPETYSRPGFPPPEVRDAKYGPAARCTPSEILVRSGARPARQGGWIRRGDMALHANDGKLACAPGNLVSNPRHPGTAQGGKAARCTPDPQLGKFRAHPASTKRFSVHQ